MFKLRALRLELDWTLLKVASLTGISPGDISEIERGYRKVYPGWRRRLADAYGVKESDLFDPETGALLEAEAA